MSCPTTVGSVIPDGAASALRKLVKTCLLANYSGPLASSSVLRIRIAANPVASPKMFNPTPHSRRPKLVVDQMRAEKVELQWPGFRGNWSKVCKERKS